MPIEPVNLRRPDPPDGARSRPSVLPVAAIDDPALPEVLAELAAMGADEMDADTVSRAVHRAQGDRLVAAPGLDRW
ncbi:hypothetical protein [Streptomyces koyangensis]|uniref:hypothetical protein n=1 Tax=Streptomyces koyangensis TaxID=188770 RepID=UPI003390F04B